MSEQNKEVLEQEAQTADEVIIEHKSKDDVEKKIKKQIEKNKEKFEGRSRILEYLRTEHKWENYLFVVVSLVTLLLGALMLSGGLVVKDNFPVIGKYPDAFAWTLVIISGIGVIYAIFPFFKPALPEFKKISWLSGMKFVGNAIRVFLFLIIFALLFLLYDSFITQILARIFN